MPPMRLAFTPTATFGINTGRFGAANDPAARSHVIDLFVPPDQMKRTIWIGMEFGNSSRRWAGNLRCYWQNTPRFEIPFWLQGNLGVIFTGKPKFSYLEDTASTVGKVAQGLAMDFEFGGYGNNTKPFTIVGRFDRIALEPQVEVTNASSVNFWSWAMCVMSEHIW